MIWYVVQRFSLEQHTLSYIAVFIVLGIDIRQKTPVIDTEVFYPISITGVFIL